MPKMDIASFVFLAIWPGLPLVLIFWGYMNAREAGQLIESLQETTSGTITQSFSLTGGFQDHDGDHNYHDKLFCTDNNGFNITINYDSIIKFLASQFSYVS